MSQNDSKYLPELMAEKDSIDPSFVHALRLITQEIEKIKNPSSSPAKSEKNLLDVVSGRPTKIECDIRVPVESHPNINFVGRLIGPGGSTMKGIQEVTGTRMAVLGKGTVREKDRKKVEESRERNDPKYQHLDYPLHVHVSALGEVPQAYMNLGRACAEIQKLLHIDEDTEAQFAAVQSMGQGMRGGGRGGGMANPGGFRGRGGGPGRGGQRGGRGGMSRGGASGRGAASGRGMGAGMGGASSRGAARGGVRGRGAGRGQAQAYAQMKPVQEAFTDEYGYESYGAAAATAAATAGYDATGYEGYEESYDQSYDAAYGAEAAAYGDAAYVESYEDYGYGAESYDAYGNGSSAAVKPSFGVPGGSFRGKMRGGMRGRQKPY